MLYGGQNKTQTNKTLIIQHAAFLISFNLSPNDYLSRFIALKLYYNFFCLNFMWNLSSRTTKQLRFLCFHTTTAACFSLISQRALTSLRKWTVFPSKICKFSRHNISQWIDNCFTDLIRLLLSLVFGFSLELNDSNSMLCSHCHGTENERLLFSNDCAQKNRFREWNELWE